MKYILFIVLALSTLLLSFTFISIAPNKRQSPGPAPQLFGKGKISTDTDEFGATLSPDGKTCFFTKKQSSTISSNIYVICYSTLENGQWSEPSIAPFSGKYKDFNPCISPDGSTLFFCSNRPGGSKTKMDGDIWIVKKTTDGWGEPQNLGAPVNGPSWELGCSVANNGTLYFCSTGSTGDPNIYYSKFIDGKYQPPDTLGEAINSAYPETDPFIAPDESYLLFSSTGRPDALTDTGVSAAYPRSDIYISFHRDGKWTPAKNIGAPINTVAEETNPWVSHDGKTLYFTSERNFISLPMKNKLTYPALENGLHQAGNGLGDIYEIPTSIFLHQ